MPSFLLLAILLCLACVTGCHKRSEVSGTWVMQQETDGEEGDALDPKLLNWTLTLQDDGTFTEHMENQHHDDARGQYHGPLHTIRRFSVTLTGSRETYSDDGYHKGTRKEPVTIRLKYAHKTLTGLEEGTKDLVFRREGDKAPPKPKTRPKPSDRRPCRSSTRCSAATPRWTLTPTRVR